MADVIRSKNAGPYELTLDVIFKSEAHYSAVKESGFFSKELIADLYSISPQEVIDIIFFDPARALKVTLKREIPCGGIGDSDIYGAQQHGPLLNLKIPV